MADIFLSYRNLPDRRARVDRLAAILEAHGFEVWWDYGLESGESYRQQILNELTNAKVVSPLWCSESVQSRWVHMEAEMAKDKLVPARFQKVAPPTAFESVQAADLIEWDGSIDSDPLRRYIARLSSRAGVVTKERISLTRQMRLLPPLGPLASAETASENSTAAARAFLTIKDSTDIDDFRHFIESFPATEESFEARRILARIHSAKQEQSQPSELSPEMEALIGEARELCDEGDRWRFGLGQRERDAVKADTSYKRALPLLRKAVSAGVGEAMDILGDCYWYGQGMESNQPEAMRLYHMSAKSGFSGAMYSLALHYRTGGESVPKNPTKALDWFRREGSSAAMLHVAKMLETGEGCAADVPAAVEVLRKIAQEAESHEAHKAQIELIRLGEEW